MIVKTNSSATTEMIEKANAKKKQLEDLIERLKNGTVAINEMELVSWGLCRDTKKAKTLGVLHELRKAMTAIEICEYMGWSLASRNYVWTIMNYACYEGSPVKRVGLGRYQWVGE